MPSASAAPRRVQDLLQQRGGWVELLHLPALLFGAAARLRGGLYDRGLLPRWRVDAPVICAGNVSAGGTGKTPFTLHLARWFEARGRRPGVLARGHGRRALSQTERGQVQPAGATSPWSDEGRLYQLHCPGILHVEDPDRVRGAQRLVAAGAEVILMDDGFQHRRLRRDLDCVLIDATQPWGLPWDSDGTHAPAAFLPRGLLREPKAALARAALLVLTRCDQIPAQRLQRLCAELLYLAPAAAQLQTRHAPQALVALDGTRFGLERLQGRSVDLVSAIGNPAAFERTVTALGAEIALHRRFPDHHAYRAEDLVGLGQAGRLVLTTEKDLVKLQRLLPGALALSIELAIDVGAEVLDALLEALPLSRAADQRRQLHEGLHG
jgi:tetraacyldisaccharide 4'-kinase